MVRVALGSPPVDAPIPGTSGRGTVGGMSDHRFSFGVVLTSRGSGRDWVAAVRATERQGWNSLLVPDTLRTPSPFPTLAAAAAATSTLQLRTWVLAGPLRSPAAVVREASALQALSDGRFELASGPVGPTPSERRNGWACPGARPPTVSVRWNG